MVARATTSVCVRLLTCAANRGNRCPLRPEVHLPDDPPRCDRRTAAALLACRHCDRVAREANAPDFCGTARRRAPDTAATLLEPDDARPAIWAGPVGVRTVEVSGVYNRRQRRTGQRRAGGLFRRRRTGRCSPIRRGPRQTPRNHSRSQSRCSNASNSSVVASWPRAGKTHVRLLSWLSRWGLLIASVTMTTL